MSRGFIKLVLCPMIKTDNETFFEKNLNKLQIWCTIAPWCFLNSYRGAHMFKRFVLITALILMPTLALASQYIEGKDYVLVKPMADQPPTTGTVLVTEFFSYGCPWCYKIEPQLKKWAEEKNPHVSFDKIPVVYNKDWEYYAKAYYTVQALSEQDKVSPKIFQAILKDKKRLNSNHAMVEFLTHNGLDGRFVKSAFYNSPSVNLELTNSKRMMMDYKIAAVPAVVVQNKYKTDLKMAGSEERFFKILDYLVNKSTEKNA
jgi:protein dithiol oxidoreductase (disulfide-forming)